MSSKSKKLFIITLQAYLIFSASTSYATTGYDPYQAEAEEGWLAADSVEQSVVNRNGTSVRNRTNIAPVQPTNQQMLLDLLEKNTTQFLRLLQQPHQHPKSKEATKALQGLDTSEITVTRSKAKPINKGQPQLDVSAAESVAFSWHNKTPISSNNTPTYLTVYNDGHTAPTRSPTISKLEPTVGRGKPDASIKVSKPRLHVKTFSAKNSGSKEMITFRIGNRSKVIKVNNPRDKINSLMENQPNSHLYNGTKPSVRKKPQKSSLIITQHDEVVTRVNNKNKSSSYEYSSDVAIHNLDELFSDQM